MKTRIFVGNLAYTATSADIQRTFEPFGEVVSVYLYSTGKRRFAFVTLTNEADGESAIEVLDQSQLFERTLLVQWAIKQRPLPVCNAEQS
jgi:RNA recognition motif-containing protein